MPDGKLPKPPQACAVDGCANQPAYKTRTRPTWCDEHITAICASAGLTPLEPFATTKAYRLTRCDECGCEAHYRFEYVLTKNAENEATCRACFWRAWAVSNRAMLGHYAATEPVSTSEAELVATANNYDYLGPLTRPSLPDDPHHVRCRHCGRLSAQRLADIGWGCQCQVNPRRDRQASKLSERERAQEAAGPGDDHKSLSREILEQWDWEQNGKVNPSSVSAGSRRTFAWREASCGHTWLATPTERQKRQRLRCPECRTILDSLAYHFPLLASEWSPRNPTSAWHVRGSGQTTFLPEWICRRNPSHVWHAPLVSRSAGSECPQCREPGKSSIELKHYEAVQTQFSNATSGPVLRSPSFVRRTSWTADILTELPDGRSVVIEYDGAYWHSEKGEIDRAKTLDLLSAGYLVTRIRELPLASLGITHADYIEVFIPSTGPDPVQTVKGIHDLVVSPPDQRTWSWPKGNAPSKTT